MADELMTLDDIAALYHCSRRHARDVITKAVGFPEQAPGASPRNPLWIRAEVRAFVHRRPAKSRRNPESAHATL